MLSGTACDGEVLALDCSGYQNTINILHAWYQVDSFPFSCGQNHDYSSSTSCPAFDAMDEILSKCQGYKKCLISVSESSFPVQSCARVRRRLEVFYRCNSTNNRSKMSSFSLLQSLLSTYIVMVKSYIWNAQGWQDCFVCYFSNSETRVKNFRIELDLNYDLCNTGALPVELSLALYWPVIKWAHDNP